MGDGKQLAGRVAIVTGASRGIGRAVALAYATEGASVVLAARNETDLEAVGAEASRLGAEVLVQPTDVTSEADVERMAAAARHRFGRIDVLVNNAGVGQGLAGRPVRTLLDVDLALWDTAFAVNCRGPFLCMRAVLPAMVERGRGRIISISSNYARRFSPGSVPYAPTKAALEHLTLTAAAEFATHGIRINVLHPGGPVDTAIFTEHFQPVDPRRMRPPEIISAAAIWLASDAAADVTGQIVDCRDWNAEHGIPVPPVGAGVRS